VTMPNIDLQYLYHMGIREIITENGRHFKYVSEDKYYWYWTELDCDK